ncbi:hypothetical protein [Candidatus Rariloculus sp.]|uniref:hypothetical protein n=1 Tax=Candidatus Rariloculus sp. TaxID=3101265 RepID=UPI003D117DB6
MTRLLSIFCAGAALGAGATAIAQQAPTARAAAPVDLTGYWVSVVSEDWAWRMRTPLKGDYESVPLNADGVSAADSWSEVEDGSCLAFGAAALLRMPTRLRIAWEDEQTLQLETDNGEQTRLLRFGTDASPSGRRTLQGRSVAEWQITTEVVASGATAGVLTTRLDEPSWASLEVVTADMSAAWLRPNGVPNSENAVMTEYFDRFSDAEDEWFTVTTILDDPTYLTEPFIVSSNFKREADGSNWRPTPCRP